MMCAYPAVAGGGDCLINKLNTYFKRSCKTVAEGEDGNDEFELNVGVLGSEDEAHVAVDIASNESFSLIASPSSS